MSQSLLRDEVSFELSIIIEDFQMESLSLILGIKKKIVTKLLKRSLYKWLLCLEKLLTIQALFNK
jgi:hypothetical protein